MSKNDFESFPIGSVFNECQVAGTPVQTADRIVLDYPSRLEAMALDPSQIADNDNLVYRAGQIDITVPLFKRVTVEAGADGGDIHITDSTPRPALVRHAAEIIRHALGVERGLTIDVADGVNLRHCGLGSSSSLIASVASSVNEMYGKPIRSLDLVRYLAQNHGEEIDGDNERLIPVQCIGGSAVCGNFKGGIIALAGEATPIASTDISNDYAVVIGVPRDFTHPDSQALMQAEIDNMEGFRNAGLEYGREVAYRLVHQVLPAMVDGDIRSAGDLIYDYRWNMGSIRNCAFVFPRITEIADSVGELYREGSADIVSLSSVGPGFFAVTKEPDRAVEVFEANNMQVLRTHAHNGTYEIVDRS